MSHVHRDTVRIAVIAAVVLACAVIGLIRFADASTTEELSQRAHAAINRLTDTNATAKTLSQTARAVLVFPHVARAELMTPSRPSAEFNGTYGQGALIKNGATIGFFNSITAERPRENDDRPFAYAAFLMTGVSEAALAEPGGWTVGAGPSIAFVDGELHDLSTPGSRKDIYIFAFDESGVIAGDGLRGARIDDIATR
jgi:hypothetical protein